MFFGFPNFYRRFIKRFSKIAAPLISMLKTTTLLALDRPDWFETNENELNTDGNSDISSSRIDDRIVNLSSIIKKMSSKAGFITFKASLAFI